MSSRCIQTLPSVAVWKQMGKAYQSLDLAFSFYIFLYQNNNNYTNNNQVPDIFWTPCYVIGWIAESCLCCVCMEVPCSPCFLCISSCISKTCWDNDVCSVWLAGIPCKLYLASFSMLLEISSRWPWLGSVDGWTSCSYNRFFPLDCVSSVRQGGAKLCVNGVRMNWAALTASDEGSFGSFSDRALLNMVALKLLTTWLQRPSERCRLIIRVLKMWVDTERNTKVSRLPDPLVICHP